MSKFAHFPILDPNSCQHYINPSIGDAIYENPVQKILIKLTKGGLFDEKLSFRVKLSQGILRDGCVAQFDFS